MKRAIRERQRAKFELLGPADLARDDDWWNIYEHSFPDNEREPGGVILESLRASVGLAFRARRGDSTVAIATTHLLLSPPAVFLVYLAVESRHRHLEIGGKLFEYARFESERELMNRGSHPLGLIWEVDPPGAGPSATSDPATRRIRFFEKHGGILLDHNYRQPPVNGPDSVPMRLMFRPAAAKTVPNTATLTDLVRAIYFEKYAAVNRIPAETLERLLGSTGNPR